MRTLRNCGRLAAQLRPAHARRVSLLPPPPPRAPAPADSRSSVRQALNLGFGPQAPGHPVSDRPASAHPASDRPVPNRPTPVHPIPNRPAPDRPAHVHPIAGRPTNARFPAVRSPAVRLTPGFRPSNCWPLFCFEKREIFLSWSKSGQVGEMARRFSHMKKRDLGFY